MRVSFTNDELEDHYDVDKLNEMEKHGEQFRTKLKELMRDINLCPTGNDILRDAEMCAITMRVCMEVLVDQNMLARLLYPNCSTEQAAEGTARVLHSQFCEMLVKHINNRTDHFIALHEQLKLNKELNVH